MATPLSGDALAKQMVLGLLRLADELENKEINFFVYPPTFKSKTGKTVRDVPFIVAADTPDASQVVYDGSRSYDAWSPDGKGMRSANMTLQQAAKLICTEYFWAKAARIKARDPAVNIDELMQKLDEGYQQK